MTDPVPVPRSMSGGDPFADIPAAESPSPSFAQRRRLEEEELAHKARQRPPSSELTLQHRPRGNSQYTSLYAKKDREQDGRDAVREEAIRAAAMEEARRRLDRERQEREALEKEQSYGSRSSGVLADGLGASRGGGGRGASDLYSPTPSEEELAAEVAASKEVRPFPLTP